MELNNAQRLAKNIFRLLKVNEISFPIGRTNKGNLTIVFNDSKEDFDLFLDSVPLPTKSLLEDDKNIELKQMVEKYWFDKDGVIMPHSFGGQFRGVDSLKDFLSDEPITQKTVSVEDSDEAPIRTLADLSIDGPLVVETKKSRGRPAGSKNRK